MKVAHFIFTLILCATGSVAFAQQPPKPEPAKPAAKPEPQAPPPTMTHEESLELENLQLKFSIAQTQQQSLQSQYQAFVQGLNAEHPGFSFNVQTGQFIAVPKSPAEKK